jgi:hypothetical protein
MATGSITWKPQRQNKQKLNNEINVIQKMRTKILQRAAYILLVAVFACEEEGEKAVLKSDVAPNSMQSLSASSYTL